jgi:hypothetical protein
VMCSRLDSPTFCVVSWRRYLNCLPDDTLRVPGLIRRDVYVMALECIVGC